MVLTNVGLYRETNQLRGIARPRLPRRRWSSAAPALRATASALRLCWAGGFRWWLPSSTRLPSRLATWRRPPSGSRAASPSTLSLRPPPPGSVAATAIGWPLPVDSIKTGKQANRQTGAGQATVIILLFPIPKAVPTAPPPWSRRRPAAHRFRRRSSPAMKS